MSCLNILRTAVFLSAFAVTSAVAADAEFVLKAQTFNSPESVSGKNIATFVDDVQIMSGGRIKIEMFYSSAVVKTAETFDAVRNNILDLDVTSAAYLVGKDKAFQMVGDVMGGYENPWQMYAWLYNADGYQQAQALYDKYDMQLLAWMVPGTESLASTKPLEGFEALKGWKFRSPPGLQTKIFEGAGATPVVMDFTEVFTALETGIIDGADQSNLANNASGGIYSIAKHTTYPGFHSMPAEHVALRKGDWERMPDDLKRILSVAAEKMAFQTSLDVLVVNEEARNSLEAQGVAFYDWSAEDRAKFREMARKAWTEWAKDNDTAVSILESHQKFMTTLGLLQN